MENKKILVVDDEKDICDAFKVMIERYGCKVFTALKAQDAWEIFQREKPQACTIDIFLPFSAYDGLELLKKIRAIDKETFCIVFSCAEEKDKGQKALSLGADVYLEKPLDALGWRSLVDLLVKGKK